MPVMGLLKRYRARWKNRRMQLATQQLEADRHIDDLAGRNPATDGITGEYYASRRALGGILNPRAKTTTEWRGD
jgi:hypothetical protein